MFRGPCEASHLLQSDLTGAIRSAFWRLCCTEGPSRRSFWRVTGCSRSLRHRSRTGLVESPKWLSVDDPLW